MKFSSIEGVEAYLLSQSEVAMQIAMQKVYEILYRFIEQFYSEYNPKWYRRLFQLYSSLIKVGVRSTGNGWEAVVQFDASAMSHDANRPVYTQESEDWILNTALTDSAPHGGYAGGTPIWTEGLKVVSAEAISILKQALIDAGIPIS